MSRSPITTDPDNERGPFPADPSKLERFHPGEHLKEELEFLEMSGNQLAKALGVDASRITELVAGRRNMTADTALRLEKYGIGTAALWMSLQTSWDLQEAKKANADAIAKIKHRAA
jgi:addiction module HigA family antidote